MNPPFIFYFNELRIGNIMTQEEKQLLLKDLCGRLPYGVKFQGEDSNVYTLDAANYFVFQVENVVFKPYLRPMSSMTEEERKQLYSAIDYYGKIDKDGDIDASDHDYVFSETCIDYIDWLNEHHFDYRGLIEKGLALEASEDMYKNE